jgi:hypothetical protein
MDRNPCDGVAAADRCECRCETRPRDADPGTRRKRSEQHSGCFATSEHQMYARRARATSRRSRRLQPVDTLASFDLWVALLRFGDGVRDGDRAEPTP